MPNAYRRPPQTTPNTYRACAEPTTGNGYFIQKMRVRCKAHDAASRHQLDSIVEAMVKIALERSRNNLKEALG